MMTFKRDTREVLIKSQERLNFRMREYISDVIDILQTNDLDKLIKWSERVTAEMSRANRRQSAALHVLLVLATQSDVDSRDNVVNDVRALGRALGVM